MATELQPLGFSDRLTAAQKLYVKNFWTLIAIVAVIVIPFELFFAIVSPNIEAVDTTGTELVGSGVLALLALFVLGFVVDLLATGSATKAIVDDYLGNEPDALDSIRYALSRLWPLALGAILFFFGVVVGLIFFIIPGIILAVSWSLFVPAVIVEDRSATGALGRSNELVKGRRWPVFGYILAVAIAVGLFSAFVATLLGGLFGVEPDEISLAGTVINILIALITTPFVVATYVVLYFDQRVRHEPLDMEQLAAQMITQPPQSEFGSMEGDAPPEGFGSLGDESPPAPPPSTDDLD